MNWPRECYLTFFVGGGGGVGLGLGVTMVDGGSGWQEGPLRVGAGVKGRPFPLFLLPLTLTYYTHDLVVHHGSTSLVNKTK